jgi:hypothetical protein
MPDPIKKYYTVAAGREGAESGPEGREEGPLKNPLRGTDLPPSFPR